VKNVLRYKFSRFDKILVHHEWTDGKMDERTDGHLATASSALCIRVAR